MQRNCQLKMRPVIAGGMPRQLMYDNVMRSAQDANNETMCAAEAMMTIAAGNKQSCMNSLIQSTILGYASEKDDVKREALGSINVDRLRETCDNYASRFTVDDAVSYCRATSAAKNAWWSQYHSSS